MKTKPLWAALAATLILASCDKNDALTTNSGSAIRFTTTIAGNSDGSCIDTRAAFNPDGSGTFADGDKLALRVTGSYGFPAVSIYTIGTTVLRWDDFAIAGNEGTLAFAGYYPSDAQVDNDKNSFDIINNTNPDLLVAPAVTVTKGEPVHLAFRHVMHRLVVNLSGNALTADELSRATVQLSRFMYSMAIIDFTDATAFADNNFTYADAPTQTGASVAFILVPQDIIDVWSENITITAGGRTLTYTLPATLPGNEATPATPRRLLGGHTLTLNLAINTANRRAAASATTPSTRAAATDDALTLECVGIDVSGR